MKLLKHKSFILFILSGAFLCAGVLSFVFNECRVKVIKIEGISQKTVLYGLENIKNSPLLTLSTQEVEERIKKSNPFVLKIQVNKQYPQTLILTILSDAPFVYFEADLGFFALSSEGKILVKIKEKQASSDLPVIYYFEKLHFASYQPGDYISLNDINMALKFIKSVTEQGMKVNTIDIDGVDMIRLNLKGKTILFSSEKEIGPQVYQLGQIIHQFKIQGNEFKKLDLRFNRPILELVE